MNTTGWTVKNGTGVEGRSGERGHDAFWAVGVMWVVGTLNFRVSSGGEGTFIPGGMIGKAKINCVRWETQEGVEVR